MDGLCGKCSDSHDDACFVNQVRRVLIAVLTGVDLGPSFDGRSELKDLIAAATQMASSGRSAKATEPAPAAEARASAASAPPTEKADDTAVLRRQLEEQREREVFRETLVDEIVATIGSVSDGNYTSEMPVHDDPQLGKLATAFNLMLANVKRTMACLDELVQARSAELRRIMDHVDKGIFTIDTELRIGPEYSACCRRLFAVDDLRGRSFLEVLGVVGRRSEASEQVHDFADLYFQQLMPEDVIPSLNPIAEFQFVPSAGGAAAGRWIAFRFFPLRDEKGAVVRLMGEATDISAEKRLAAEVDAANVRNAQVSAIASDLDLFQAFAGETRQILQKVSRELERFRSGGDPQESARELFRGVHTVKGTAAVFKLAHLVEVAGKLEAFLSPLRQCEHASPEMATTVEQGLAAMQATFGAALELARPILGRDLDEGSATCLRVPVAAVEKAIQFAAPILSRAGAEGEQALALLRTLHDMPARKAFARSVKAIPPLAERLGKNIRFVFSGENTMVPAPLAAPIDAALMHILRNACDHGIEASEDREALGKPEQGTIELSCERSGGRLILTVRDDGGGIDPERVKGTAVEKGLLTSSQADALSREEIYRLLVTPGFSTRQEATDVSGRGVGLDVAVTEIERGLGGSLQIESTVGRGTSMRLTVPGL